MAALVPETPAVGDEVKPYKIHVSSKYLDLTRQKLELTRLPHENANPRSTNWWEPKPSVEPLIDYWLERFSWRDQEARLNTLPQFRTSLALPGGDYLQAGQQPPALRVHFLHFRSPRPGAVPLLLVPPFPFTNLLLAHLAAPLTDPPASGAPSAAPGTSEGADRKPEIRPPTIAEETEPSTPSPPRSDKGKGKEGNPSQERQLVEKENKEMATTPSSPTVVGSPSVPLAELLKPPARDLFTSDDESPDTLVVTTPPLGGTPPVTSPAPNISSPCCVDTLYTTYTICRDLG
ncbi:epoxide hydrolase [Magnaporthiopsis poae ATCC 64411]|uniref:Epoxide hydrolase n=1 Tax=Magnaporthiopsis poae (strain ATCC 64411 / 73-15) TaxID=644358 RepID=A0A0C4DZ61_MAGP6|nr:epoxide hydrolase [Magnaporthiopsis poae ATCC 64411]